MGAPIASSQGSVCWQGGALVNPHRQSNKHPVLHHSCNVHGQRGGLPNQQEHRHVETCVATARVSPHHSRGTRDNDSRLFMLMLALPPGSSPFLHLPAVLCRCGPAVQQAAIIHRLAAPGTSSWQESYPTAQCPANTHQTQPLRWPAAAAGPPPGWGPA